MAYLNPWAKDPANPYTLKAPPVQSGAHVKVLVTGAGYGSLLFAVRLILEAGFQASDFIFVDSAWGWGGTWYWNRYPGLMCDVESACYLPLLEETGYIPKHRYSYGPELREYAELVAARWNLQDRALFGSTVKSTTWDAEASEWITLITRKPVDGPEESLTVRSDMLLLASGILSRAKLPNVPGLGSFEGHMFHTSRWDYGYTGGSPTDPTLDRLRGKKVAVIGTGATGIQVVPQLARWASKLYVFQRTPSAVDERGQRPIDPEHWKAQFGGKEGWQRQRRENMAAFLSNIPDKPTEDLVADEWTRFPSMSGLVGGPANKTLTMENVEQHLGSLHVLDLARQERVRSRVSEIVRDEGTAEKLKAWYPGWCKRPCFHDDYLGAFNRPNVTLVDTDGRGINRLSPNGVVFNGREYDVDVIIWGTGFESYTVGSPAFRSRTTVVGRNGLSLDDKWKSGPATLHGVFTKDFPNLILSGLTQAGGTVNVVHALDTMARHVARVVSMAKRRSEALGAPGKLLLEPTEEAENAWALRVAQGAIGFSALPGCTPSYTTAEGQRAQATSEEDQLKIGKGLTWAYGILDYTQELEAWEARGDLSDLTISWAP
ncbi:hypothetical protein VUR80DRAFT_4081 [Thermomyces stellatus]